MPLTLHQRDELRPCQREDQRALDRTLDLGRSGSPIWRGPEVLALINAKEKEHEASKLAGDNRNLMETAT
jgi:hypothetical protein